MSSNVVIVTRHQGALDWLRTHLPDMIPAASSDAFWSDVPVMSVATADDVRGRIVVGNVPFHLAAEALMVIAIEFTGTPPRGQEYTAQDMDAAGARLRIYRVECMEGITW